MPSLVLLLSLRCKMVWRYSRGRSLHTPICWCQSGGMEFGAAVAFSRHLGFGSLQKHLINPKTNLSASKAQVSLFHPHPQPRMQGHHASQPSYRVVGDRHSVPQARGTLPAAPRRLLTPSSTPRIPGVQGTSMEIFTHIGRDSEIGIWRNTIASAACRGVLVDWVARLGGLGNVAVAQCSIAAVQGNLGPDPGGFSGLLHVGEGFLATLTNVGWVWGLEWSVSELPLGYRWIETFLR
jgi:hypothetical protein